MRHPLAAIRNAVQIIQLSQERSDNGRTDWIEVISRQLKNVFTYVDYLATMVRYPRSQADIPLDALPKLHEDLNAVLGVNWPTDTSDLASGAGRKVTAEYFRFMLVIAHAILLTVRRSFETSARVAYSVEPDRLVGRVDVADAIEIDPDGWNLVRLAAAVYNVTVAEDAAAGTLTVRWEVPLS
jgi:hypothetical protein